MDSSETLRYWRYARLQLAAEGQALRRSCRYDVRPHPAGRLLSLSPSGKLRMCPLMRGAFFRAIRRCTCEFGGLAALGLTATTVDWDLGRTEVQLTLEYRQRYVIALNVAHTGAVLLASYGNPGGHALGAQRAGLSVVLLDIAEGSAIADAQRYFSAPRNRSPLVHVVSGDATDGAVCDAAVAAHPTHTDQFATIGTPPCSPTSMGWFRLRWAHGSGCLDRGVIPPGRTTPRGRVEGCGQQRLSPVVTPDGFPGATNIVGA